MTGIARFRAGCHIYRGIFVAIDSGLMADLEARGLIAQRTADEALDEHLTEMRTIYCGFDPTADSLHLGHLVPLLVLKRFQLAGHRPIALVGGATGMIGDPSFKAEERKLNTTDVIREWSDKIRSQVSQFIDFECGENSAIVANNYDWTKDYDVLTFLRDVGKHFSVNAMINKESVQQRLNREGAGISFTEFSYALLQALDFAEQYRLYDCTLQLGGSDQWGNIVGGIDLTRRQNGGQVYGLTVPLVIKADGTKFGKTESGTVWLDAAKTSPYAFYQFWINTADADVYKFLKYFTFLPVEEIQQLEQEDAKRQGRKEGQGVLAREATRLVHGDEGLASAERISQALFSGNLTDLSEADLEQLAQDGMPSTRIDAVQLELVQALVDTGLAVNPRGQVSLGQARKFISGNAISVNGEKVTDEEMVLVKSQALYQRFYILGRGKKNYHLLILQ